MKTRGRTKVIAFFVALTMLMSLFPTTALATAMENGITPEVVVNKDDESTGNTNKPITTDLSSSSEGTTVKDLITGGSNTIKSTADALAPSRSVANAVVDENKPNGEKAAAETILVPENAVNLNLKMKEIEDGAEKYRFNLKAFADFSSLTSEQQKNKKATILLPEGLVFEKTVLDGVKYIDDRTAEITIADTVNKKFEMLFDVTEGDYPLLANIMDDEDEKTTADILMDVYSGEQQIKTDAKDKNSAFYTLNTMSIGMMLTPLMAPAPLADGVTVGNGVPTFINMGSVKGNVIIKADGLYIGTEHVDTALNPAGYEFTGSNSPNGYTITVDAGVTTTVYFNNLTMKTPTPQVEETRNLFDCSHSDTTIILKGKNVFANETKESPSSLQTRNGCIVKNGSDGKLTIGCEHADKPAHNCNSSCGSLDVSATLMHTTIIGNNFTAFDQNADDRVFSNCYITGGNITAKSSPHMPGIGAACAWDHGGKLVNLHITGGVIDATGGEECAGIGTGSHGVPIDGLYINGGAKVTARGGNNAPGVGTGGGSHMNKTDYSYSIKNLVISGGETVVTAYGDRVSNMPGIGCGYDPSNPNAPRSIEANAFPEKNYQGYVKFGTSSTDFEYSAANPPTPFHEQEEFGKRLEEEANKKPVFYTQVYFGPYKDNNAADKKTEMGANDAVMKTGGAPLSADDLRRVTQVVGHDSRGNPIVSDKIIPNQDDMDAINKAKTSGKVGDFPLRYTHKYRDPDTGEEKELTVTCTVSLRDEGSDASEPMPAIAANNGIHITGGNAFSDDDLLKLCDVSANDILGRNVIRKKDDGSIINNGVTLDDAQKAAINAAKQAGKTGTFPLTFTFKDPDLGVTKTVTVNVELRDFGTNNVEPGNPENGANKATHRSDGGQFSEQDVRDLTKAIAKDSNGNTIPANELVPDPGDFAALNAARAARQEGVFEIKYTYKDIDGKTITFKGQITLWNDTEPIITANDKTIHSNTAKTINDKNDLATYLNPQVTDKFGQPAVHSGVTVSDEDMGKIKAGTPGVYPVTYTYNYSYIDENGVKHDDGQKSVTVNLTVIQDPVINATDKTIKSSEARQTIKGENDLAQHLNPSVVDENGKPAMPTEVSVSPENMEKIKNGVEGTYPVTYKYKYTDNTGDAPVEKTVEKTVNLTITNAAAITGNDKTVLDEAAKKYKDKEDLKAVMGASATKDDGSQVPANEIKTEVSDGDWAKIKAGTPGSYPVKFTYTDPSGKKVEVTKTLTINTTPKVEAVDATVNSTAARNTIKGENDLAQYLNPSTTDVLGRPTTHTEVSVSPEDMEKIKNGVEGTYPVTYKYTYTDMTGDAPVEKTVEKTVNLTVTNAAAINAQNKTVLDEVAKTYTDKNDLKAVMGASATKDDGSPVPADEITTEVSDDDWAKIKAGTPGDYPVKFTYTDPSGKKVEVARTLTVHTTPTVNATDATVSSTTARNTIKGESDLAQYLKPTATDVLGKPTTPTEVSVSPENMEKIKNGVEGTYPVTYKYTYTDMTGDAPVEKTVEKTVNLTITNAAAITGNDKTVLDENAKAFTEKNDLVGAMGVVATMDDGTEAPASDITPEISDEVWEKIKAGKPGVYPIKFTYTDPSGKKVEIIKNLTINTMPAILVEDLTVCSGEAKDYFDVPDDLALYFAPRATDIMGEDDDVSGVKVAPEDMEKIKNGVVGKYPVTYTYTYTDYTGNAPEEKTIEKTVYLTITSVFGDPPVEKEVVGDAPGTDATFTFVFTAKNEANPMPEGSNGSTKEMSIVGGGSVEFGNMEFIRPGTYEYTVSEKNTGEENYTYDETVYTVTFVVTDNNGVLEIQRTITYQGKEAESAKFTNRYTKPVEPAAPAEPSKPAAPAEPSEPATPVISPMPKTGDRNNLIMWISLLGIASIGIIGLIIFRRNKKSK